MSDTPTNQVTKKRKKTTTSSLAQQERLITVLHSLEEQIQRQTSLRFAFLRGVVYGFGTVIGATLLLALFGGILAATINSLSQLPIIGNYVNQEVVDNLE
jgi:hypothetical protein